MVILDIQSSPRGEKSASIAVTKCFLEAYADLHPDTIIDTLNVWDESLPEFDGAAIGAKYKNVSHEDMSTDEARTWERIQSLINRFRRADRIVLGVPMWNFAYPYKLKQLIDLVCQRKFLFTFENGVYGPLLETPRALIVYARGQTYAEGTPTPPSLFDHQTAYLEFWLRFVGVRQLDTVTVENTWSELQDAGIVKGQDDVRRLVADF